MNEQEQIRQWARFGPAFWDNQTLVARSSDSCWIYPGTGFEPEAGQYYYLTLTQRISQRTYNPYYTAYPHHGGVAEPP